MSQTRAEPAPNQTSYRILGQAGASPLVFASPHSGRAYPGDMGARRDLTDGDLRSAEDAFVDQLVEPASLAVGAPLLVAEVGRAYVDLNRAAEDLDPALIDGASGGGARVAAGYGVIPRLSGSGRPLYDRRLTLEEAQARVAAAHTPYHAALDGLMNAARDRFGAAVLIDWHSMPARATAGRTAGGRCDVVLGDRHGTAAAREVTRGLAHLFEEAGWRVALNHPYAGGYSTQAWGRPDEGFHAVQVELNRALYLDEARLTPAAGYQRTIGVVTRVATQFAARDWSAILAG